MRDDQNSLPLRCKRPKASGDLTHASIIQSASRLIQYYDGNIDKFGDSDGQPLLLASRKRHWMNILEAQEPVIV